MKRFITGIVLLFVSICFGVQDNEKLTFNIRYGLVSAASAELSTSFIEYSDSVNVDSVRALKVVSIAKTYKFFDVFFKVRDKITSISELESGKALYYSKKLREGGYKQKRVHYYDRDNKNCIYMKWSRKKKKYRTYNIAIPDSTYDFLGAFYSIRQQELAVGDSVKMYMSGDGVTFLAQIVVHRAETLDTIFGKKECLVIEPQLVGETIFKNSGRIFIWITNDEYKIPVKMESEVKFGSFIADLTKAENVGLSLKGK
ncbi:MAG: hypothetical protein B6226_03435 [Candidatus Cloacimonetes bacterium 4572_65]|nr:MAG: hypothetical protein B6226_03435 [Candidatus Cloacimonetes bacterium 4572_65]